MEELSNKLDHIGSNILFCNVQGLYNHIDLTKPKILMDMALFNDAFCICLCETHLNDNIIDSELTNEGWTIVRSDRKGRICGGTAIYINENVPISEKFVYSNSVCDAVGIYIPLSDLIIVTVYRPPSATYEKFGECMKSITKWLNDIIDTNGHIPKFFINGDFNFPTMGNWNEMVVTKFVDSLIKSYDRGNQLSVINNQIKILYEFTEMWLLTQKIHENTRIQNTLDLFFTNDENSISNSEIIRNISFSDHNLVKLYTNITF